MMTAKEKWIDNLLGSMTLEQKVGQLMVFGFAGPVITPLVKDFVTKYHVGGLRVTQKFFPGVSHGSDVSFNKAVIDKPSELGGINCTANEYAETLNRLRDYALDRKDSIGLHFSFDAEGEMGDFFVRQRFFPYAMGVAATKDTSLAYNIARSVAIQTRALGLNMIHSPVLDVNTNPSNPEIGTRSYSNDPDIVAEFAMAALRGFSEEGIICTGKHFPGRGESEADAHHSLPTVKVDYETMHKIHLAPYKKLIDAGLPAIMAAFSHYPALLNTKEVVPAAASYDIIGKLLREEMGFKGVVTTDNMQMRGLLDKYPLEKAAVHCLNAGCDLLLYRGESVEAIKMIESVKEAVRTKAYPEAKLDESVRRILAMRWDMGLAENGGKVDASKAGEPFDNPFVKKTAKDAAERTTVILRNNDNVLPLDPEKKILFVEQAHHMSVFANNVYSHPGMIWEELREHSDNVALTLIKENYTTQDEEAALKRAASDDIELIVCTNYYNLRQHNKITDLIYKLEELGKPMVVISNTPFEKFTVPERFPTVVVNLSPGGRENAKAIADVLFGKLVPETKYDVRLK